MDDRTGGDGFQSGLVIKQKCVVMNQGEVRKVGDLCYYSNVLRYNALNCLLELCDGSGLADADAVEFVTVVNHQLDGLVLLLFFHDGVDNLLHFCLGVFFFHESALAVHNSQIIAAKGQVGGITADGILTDG